MLNLNQNRHTAILNAFTSIGCLSLQSISNFTNRVIEKCWFLIITTVLPDRKSNSNLTWIIYCFQLTVFLHNCAIVESPYFIRVPEALNPDFGNIRWSMV